MDVYDIARASAAARYGMMFNFIIIFNDMKKILLFMAVPALMLFACKPIEGEPSVEYDIDFVANEMEAMAVPPELVGMVLDIEAEYHLFAINMSDNGLAADDSDLPNSTYFVAGFFYDAENAVFPLKIEDGVYKYDAGNPSASGNLVPEMCYYTRTGEVISDIEVEYIEDLCFTDVTLTVVTEGNTQRFELIATLEDGRKARAVYSGIVEFEELVWEDYVYFLLSL